jgi:hypothetical protein
MAAMAKPPTPESIAAGLTAIERVLLFCVGSGTDWRKIVVVGTAKHMLIRGLIERDGSDLALTRAGPRGAGGCADDAGGDAGDMAHVIYV